MAAYAFSQISSVGDPERFKEYQRLSRRVLEQYGGTFVGGLVTEQVDGEWSPQGLPYGLAAFEFPSMESLNAWYYSPEHQELIEMRHATAVGAIVFVDGSLMPDLRPS